MSMLKSRLIFIKYYYYGYYKIKYNSFDLFI